MSDSNLDAGVRAVKKTNKVPSFMELTYLLVVGDRQCIPSKYKAYQTEALWREIDEGKREERRREERR